jgi:Fungal specific transcription factor domain
MMAVAALSLAHQEGNEIVDALQHYQKALPALQSNLRSAGDLSSDGAFLTHFLLLVYEVSIHPGSPFSLSKTETDGRSIGSLPYFKIYRLSFFPVAIFTNRQCQIAAAETGGSNLWSSHIAQLLRISLLRREVFGGERFPFITWWICNIDLYALFSGAGPGEYVGTMLKNDMMPPPSFHLYPLGIDGASIVYAEETESLPVILQLNYEVTILAVRLGLLAQELRRDATALAFDSHEIGSHQRHVSTKIRQRRVFELQEALRQLWASPNILMLGQQPGMLPPRSRQAFEHASALYRSCLIYSHTSMWPSQRLDTGPEFDPEIALCVAEILRIGDRIVSQEQHHLRFVIFPLFMAGVASIDGNEKMLALELISGMEKESIGSNTTATRHALQIVYEQQTQRFMHTGQSLDVNWSDIMLEQGLQVVNFGL